MMPNQKKAKTKDQWKMLPTEDGSDGNLDKGGRKKNGKPPVLGENNA